MKPLYIGSLSLVSALGHGLAPAYEALRAGRSGLRRNDFLGSALDTWIGRVEGIDAGAEDEDGRIGDFPAYRVQRLTEAALRADGFAAAVARARDALGASRIGVFVGTSSAGMLQGELAYRRLAADSLPGELSYRDSINMFAPAAFVRSRLGLEGQAATVSTACSSSAKTFASAARAIEAGLCDAAVVGGVETICFTTLHGFASLELLWREPCRPCDAERGGISLGEGASFALLEKAPQPGESLALLGYGESADGHHMSTPHPEGLGAAAAMRSALACAGLEPDRLDYINLHGTGTRNNDSAEDLAVHSVVGDRVPCSATKGWTGHTLGAAGAVEAALTLACLRHGYLPGTLNTRRLDPALRSRVVLEGRDAPLERAMSNSFGFGGSNCSLVFGKLP